MSKDVIKSNSWPQNLLLQI